MIGGLDTEVITLLVLIALLAGCFDAIAGGGGLLTLPALLLTGLDPVTVLATNKVQSTFGVASATLAFARAKLIDWRAVWPMMLMSAGGSVLGAFFAKTLSKDVLEAVIPLVLIGIALFFAFSPKISDENAQARITPFLFGVTIALGVGTYDGMFGPGTGSFYMLGFVTLLGFGVVRATAHTKALNFSSNFGSLCFFALTGSIIWPVGLLMGIGQFIGAQMGTKLAIRFGVRIIRPLLVIMCGLMAIRLLMNPDHALRHWLML
jgi:uncharacterized protein